LEERADFAALEVRIRLQELQVERALAWLRLVTTHAYVTDLRTEDRGGKPRVRWSRRHNGAVARPLLGWPQQPSLRRPPSAP
jgi:hypothetical protein